MENKDCSVTAALLASMTTLLPLPYIRTCSSIHHSMLIMTNSIFDAPTNSSPTSSIIHLHQYECHPSCSSGSNEVSDNHISCCILSTYRRKLTSTCNITKTHRTADIPPMHIKKCCYVVVDDPTPPLLDSPCRPQCAVHMKVSFS